jgi:NTE family protein
VNPVPFDVARERFGGPVIAIAVHPGANPDSMADDLQHDTRDWRKRFESLVRQSVAEKLPAIEQWLQLWEDKETHSALPDWGVGEIYSRAMDISRAQLMRLREKISPPDLYIKPNVQHIGMLEFYHAEQAIEAGRRATLAQIEQIKALIKH